MREGLLLGGMLTNSESWINVTTKNIDELELDGVGPVDNRPSTE